MSALRAIRRHFPGVETENDLSAYVELAGGLVGELGTSLVGAIAVPAAAHAQMAAQHTTSVELHEEVFAVDAHPGDTVPGKHGIWALPDAGQVWRCPVSKVER